MKHFHDALAAVHSYDKQQRPAHAAPLAVSGLYDLFPDSPPDQSVPIHARWPEKWPGADRPGVYMVFDQALRILYVGKASMNSALGARLGTYFGHVDYPKDLTCRLVNPSAWSATPRFVATVPLSDDSAFVAPALEEFLIRTLDPPDNRQGRG
jgi:hypothetical protein